MDALQYYANLLDRKQEILLLIRKKWGVGSMSNKIKKKETKRVKIKEGVDSPTIRGDKGKSLSRDIKHLLIFFMWFIGFVIILLYNWNK